MASPRKTYDVVVAGAGVFGAWIALNLRRAGRQVLLADAFGPGNSRASSGGETRIIRMGYGAEEIYSRFAQRSLSAWKELALLTGERLFHDTGVLWMARDGDPLSTSTLATLARLGLPHERLARRELEARWPQIDFGPIPWAIHEPASGVLMARRGVQAVARQAIAEGVDFRLASVTKPAGRGRAGAVILEGGEAISVGACVFALGPWLGKVFPELLGDRIVPTRQEVYYFGTPAGDGRFAPPAMPAWIDFSEEIYGVPDIEAKGFKVAPDHHGEPFDPDQGERIPTPETLESARRYLASRFPALHHAPLVASEVCQYENSSSGDFLIDRHPGFENVWLVGGGSGHGFKHGPAVGEYAAARIEDGQPPEPRFSLSTKMTVQRREVY